jgi:hypothetical protein
MASLVLSSGLNPENVTTRLSAGHDAGDAVRVESSTDPADHRPTA